MSNLHSTASGLELHEDKRVKQPVRAASTANVTLATPGSVFDGVTLSSGDRLLLKNQAAGAENGPYVWTGAATPLTRASDAAAASDFVYGFLTYVREGTTNANTYWQFSQTAAITLGVTSLTFSSFGAGSGSVTSVAMNVPTAEFAVSGSPITGSGTLAITKATVSANAVAAGPTTGTAPWAFRALVAGDLPVMGASGAGHSAGAVPDPGASAAATKFLCEDATWQTPAGGGGGTTVAGGGSGALVPIMMVGPLTVAQPTMPFAAIPQTGFRNLRISSVLACNGTGAFQQLNMQLNGDGGTNYEHSITAGVSGAVSAVRATGQTAAAVGFIASSTTLANSAQAIEVFIPGYTGTTFKKVFRSEGGGIQSTAVTGIERDSAAGQWESTAAITSIVLTPANGSFIAGSYAVLFGEMDTVGVLLTPASNLLYQTTLSAAAASIDTGTLSQSYRDVLVEIEGRGDTAATSVQVLAQFNLDATAGNYESAAWSSASTTVLAEAITSATSGIAGIIAAASSPASSFSKLSFAIGDYAGAQHKAWHSGGGLHLSTSTGDLRDVAANGRWKSTAAITSILLAPSAGNFAAGTTVRVYGLPSAAGGASVGTGTRLRMSANQNATTGTATTLAWDTEDADADSQHYTSTANLTGTVAKTAASQTLTGTSTLFLTELSEGQVISVPGTAAEKRVVIRIASNTSLTVSTAFVNSASGQTAARVNSCIVFRQPGFFTCEIGVYSAALASGAVTLALYLNSLTTATSGTAIGQRDPTAQNSSAGYDLVVQRPFQQWDFVEVVWTQNSGGTVNVLADERTHFSVGARPTVIVAVPYVRLHDRKSQNTAGGNFASGADQTRTLTLDVDTGGIAVVASSQVTLPPGSYEYRIEAPGYQCGAHQAFLYNVTDSAEVQRGTSESSGASSATTTRSVIASRMRISAAKVLEVRHRCAVTSSTNGLGLPANFGLETYTVAEFRKVG